RIFEGFTQAEASTTRRFGGTSLGLGMSQQLVALMGGELQMHSTPGQGSCFFFTLTLPIGDAPPPKPHAHLAAQPNAPRVLIIDDHPTARAVLQRTCRSLGWSADTCEGGAQALAALHTEAVRAAPYQAIFVDWRMPGMDGWQTVQRLRESDDIAKTTVIAMVTGHGRDRLLKRSEADQALLDDFLVKPVTAAMLQDALTRNSSASPRQPMVATAGQGPAPDCHALARGGRQFEQPTSGARTPARRRRPRASGQRRAGGCGGHCPRPPPV
ncbi:MAG: response regulator, partial [Rhodoferax sp.]